MSDAFPTLEGPKIDVNLYPDSALKGIQGGNAQKTPIQAGVEGAIEGVKTGLQVYQGVQQIQANDQNATIRQNTINQLPTANALQDASLTQQQQENTIRQKQVDTLDATAAANAAAAAAKLTKDQAEAQQAKLKAQQAELQDKAVSSISSIFDTINSSGGSVAGGIDQLSQNMPTLFKAAFAHDGKSIVPNEVIAGQISQLMYQARQSGDPETIQKAQTIVDQYQALGQSLQAGQPEKSKPFTVAGATQPVDTSTGAPPGPTNATDIIFNKLNANRGQQSVIPSDTSGNPITQADANENIQGTPPVNPIGGSPISAQQPLAKNDSFQQTTDTTAKPVFPPATSLQTDYEYPAKEGQADALQVLQNPAIKKEYENLVPEAEQLLTDQSSSPLKAATQAIYNEKLAANPTKDDKTKARMLADAAREAKEYKRNPKQLEDNKKVYNSTQQLRKTVTELSGIFTRLQSIMKANDYQPPIGPSHTLEETLTEVSAKLGLSADDKLFVDQVGQQLESYGSLSQLQEVVGVANSIRGMDSDQERKAYSGVAFGLKSSLEKNISDMLLLDSKQKQLEAVNQVQTLMMRAGRSPEEQDSAAQQYGIANPAVVTKLDKINGQEYPTGNHRIQDPAEYVNKILGRGWLPNRTNTNRVYTPPTSSIKDTLQIPENIKKKGFYDTHDIPDHLSNGATPELVASVAQVESNGNPKAESDPDKQGKTAKGMMQFRDSTGESWWPKVYPNIPYDPFDAPRAAVVGQKYLSFLIGQFQGDTRLGVASYRVGQKYVEDAYNLAEKHGGDTSWDTVKTYLHPILNDDGTVKFDPTAAIPYVDKVMGDNKTPLKIRENLLSNVQQALGPLANKNSVAWASENLSNDGLHEVNKLKDVSEIKDTEGTILEKPLAAMISPTGASGSWKEESPDLFSKISQAAGSAANSFAIGAVRMALMGGDDELFAGIRMGLHGEDWQTAIGHTRAAKEEAFQANPWMYRAGMGLGAIPSVAYAPAAIVTKAPGWTAAGVGAVSGFLEGEGGFGNRGLSATIGAAFGTILAKTISPLISSVTWGVSKIVAGADLAATELGAPQGAVSDALGTAANKAATALGVKNPSGLPTVKMSGGEKRLSEGTQGLSTQELKTSAQQLMKDKDLQLGDVAPEASLNAPLDAASKNPQAAPEIRVAAGKRVDNVTSLVKQNVTKGVKGDQAYSAAGKGLKNKVTGLEKTRETTGNQNFNAAKARQPSPIRANKGKPAGTVRTFETKPVKDLIGMTVDPKTGQMVGADPIVVREVNSAMGTSEGLGQVRNSFDVLKRARSELSNKVRAGGPDSVAEKKALDKFNKVLFQESRNAKGNPGGATLETAIKQYSADSKAIEKITGNPVISKLLKKSDETKITNINELGNALMNSGAKELREAMALLNPAERDLIKNSVRGYVNNALEARGTRLPGETQAFEDFSKNLKADKIRAILGNSEGSTFVKSLLKARVMTKTANEALAKGSQTFTRAQESMQGGKLFARGAAQSIAGGATGSTANLAAGAVKAWGGAKQFFVGGGPLTAETAKEIAKIILVDRQAGLTFLRKEIQLRAQKEGWNLTKKQLVEGLRRLVPAGTNIETNKDYFNKTQSETAHISEQIRRRRARAAAAKP